MDNIAVANNDGGVRTLVKWPAIPSQEAQRADRRFFLALYSRKTTVGKTPERIQAHDIQASWPEMTSWGGQPHWYEKPSASFVFQPGDGWKFFDITALAPAQAKENRPSFGALPRFEKEQADANDWSGYAFVSREGAKKFADKRPRLLVVQPEPPKNAASAPAR